MAEEIAFENGQISNFEGLVTLTVDLVILHTIVHHSLTSTYMPNFIEIEETFCVRTYERRADRPRAWRPAGSVTDDRRRTSACKTILAH